MTKMGPTMTSLRRRHTAVVARQVDLDLLLLDTDAELIHQLNQTARFIWDHCDGEKSAGQIADLLADEFAVESNVALNDVVETLKKLREVNLVVDA